VKNYRELVREIEKLQSLAERSRAREVSAVIQSINNQIRLYEIRPEDLDFGTGSDSLRARGRRKKKGDELKAPKASRSVAPKYAGPNGQLWTGRGRSPKWVLKHITDGGALEDLLIQNGRP
jgi:DNA-binding protein H-NS